MAAGLPSFHISFGALLFQAFFRIWQTAGSEKAMSSDLDSWWLFGAGHMWLARDGRADAFFP
jgi:hypothetical protein